MAVIRPDTNSQILAAIQRLNRVAFVQSVASNDWLFNHTLNRVPITQVTDLAGNTLFAGVTATTTTVRVQTVVPITGIIYLF